MLPGGINKVNWFLIKFAGSSKQAVVCDAPI